MSPETLQLEHHVGFETDTAEEFIEPTSIEQPRLEPQMPNGEALHTFAAEILHGHLPPEVAEKVESIKEAKNRESLAQQEGLALLAEELEHGLLSRWIKSGNLVPPHILEEHSQNIHEQLTKALEKHLNTPQGEQDRLIGDLRAFLDTPAPTRDQLAEIASSLGISSSTLKLKLLPRHSRKFADEIRYHAEYRLNELARPGSSLDDKPLGWRDVVKKEVAVDADLDARKLLDQSSRRYQEAKKRFREKYGTAYEARWQPEGGIPKLTEEIQILDQTQEESLTELLENIGSAKSLFSAIARGSLSVEEAVGLIQSLGEEHKFSGGNLALHGVFSKTLTTEWIKCINRLPSPSLVGLSYTEKEVSEIEKCLEGINKLKGICGLHERHLDPVQNMEKLLSEIERTQRLFFERMDGANSLYWHFSRKGLGIISSKRLGAGETVEERNTGDWSKGVHFIKPGLGLETRVQYHAYAKGTMANAGHKVSQPFGMAVIYKLDDIMETTPFRDEPLAEPYRGHSNVSEDVTFRAAGESSEYSYSLDRAYLLPFASWEQLNLLRGNQHFAGILDQPPGTPVYKIGREIAARALKDAGYTDEWIEEHLLDPEKVIDPRLFQENTIHHDLETELFRRGFKEITSRLGHDRQVIIPLDARKGSFEPHDADNGSMPDLWKEELIRLAIQ